MFSTAVMFLAHCHHLVLVCSRAETQDCYWGENIWEKLTNRCVKQQERVHMESLMRGHKIALFLRSEGKKKREADNHTLNDTNPLLFLCQLGKYLVYNSMCAESEPEVVSSLSTAHFFLTAWLINIMWRNSLGNLTSQSEACLYLCFSITYIVSVEDGIGGINHPGSK